MGFKKDTILLFSYFIILSTVIQTEDAFVQYYQSQSQQAQARIKANRYKMIIAYAIFTFISFITFMILPYLNVSVKRLSLISCGILLIKYGCQLGYYLNILRPIFQLSAILADIIGQVLFYVSSIKFVFIICQKYDRYERMGFIFGAAVATYAFSIFLGSIFGYLFYEKTPVWLFLIGLTSLTIIAGCISYFTLMFESPAHRVNELNEQSVVRPNNNNENPADNPSQQRQCQLLKPGIALPHILKFTAITYGKKFPIMNIQIFLGGLFTYGYYLLDFLVWKSQEETPVQQKLHNDVSIMLLYSSGGVAASLLIGFCCDKLNLRKFGYGLLIYTFLSMCMLYLAIFIRYYYTTLLLFMFLGITQFALLTWLLCVCAKIYGGILEVFSLNAQSISLASSLYVVAAILFEGRMNLATRFCLELGGMLVGCLISIFFLRKLPDDRISIEYKYEDADQNQAENQGQNGEPRNDQTNNNDEFSQKADQKSPNFQNVEIQMAQQHRKMQEKLSNQETHDPQNLL